jgi:hypothetical protein
MATMKAFLFFLMFIYTTPALGQESSFITVKLPRSIQIQIPKGWWLIGEDLNRLIESSAEAVLDLSGLGAPEGKTTNLIAANSMPKTTYAAVRVDSTVPPSVMPNELNSANASDLKELGTEIHLFTKKMLPLQGQQLIDFYGTKLEKISGNPAIVSSYRRTGPKGPVIVQTIKIYTTSQEIGINLSYRESELGIWKPIILKIKKSIKVGTRADK